MSGEHLQPTAMMRRLTALPDRLLVVFFWVCVVVFAAVTAGVFTPFVVVPVAFVVVLVTWRLMPVRLAATRASGWAAVAAFVVAAGFFFANVPYASQYIFVERDPGFYALNGMWLGSHSSAMVPVWAHGVTPNLPSSIALTKPGGLDVIGGGYQFSGAKLLPGMLGIFHWIAGNHGVLTGNLVLGAIALLAVYAVARRMIGPVWALLPMIALAVSLPMATFSRSAYTEPLSLALGFIGLIFMWSSISTRKPWHMGMAGIIIGATAFDRVDGPATAIGFIVGILIALVLAFTPQALGFWRRAGLWGGVGIAVTTAIGMTALWRDARVYWNAQFIDTKRLLIVLAGLLAIEMCCLFLPRSFAVRRLALHRRGGLAKACAGLVIIVAVALITMPLWRTATTTAQSPSREGLVSGLQIAEGVAVDGQRLYSEHSVIWQTWYFGWAVVILGFAGLALIFARAIRQRHPQLLIFFCFVAAPSLLYFWNPAIVPDHMWAERRFLPVVAPGLVLCASYFIVSMWRLRAARASRTIPTVPAAVPHSHDRPAWVRIAIGVVTAGCAIAVVAWPATAWTKALFTGVQQKNSLTETQAICEAAKGRPIITDNDAFAPALRIVCDTSVVIPAAPLTHAELAQLNLALGGDAMAVATNGVDPYNVTPAVLWPFNTKAAPTFTFDKSEIRNTITHRPNTMYPYTSKVWMGTVQADGTVDLVAPRTP